MSRTRPSDFNSRLPGFYKLTIAQRMALVAERTGISQRDCETLLGETLSPEQADLMVENVIGVFGLPIGLAGNVRVNGKDYLVPMVVEETSVVAAVSSAAKLVREHGELTATATEPIMIGQIQIAGITDFPAAIRRITSTRDRLLAMANAMDPILVEHGGGARDLEVREVQTAGDRLLVVHILADVRDAMGANAINTMAETLGPLIAELTGGVLLCQILSNLSDQRLVTARFSLDPTCLARAGFTGQEVARRIVQAYEFADADPYRAATHNKGIMNGIDAVLLATGNDWRAVEAGAHAYAARDGRYRSLTRFHLDARGQLQGELEMPLAVGTIGGVTKIHEGVKIIYHIMGFDSTRELTELIGGIGLLQNFCAIRALVSEGIQRGHMSLHAKNLAVFAGADPALAHRVGERLVREGTVTYHRAVELVKEMRGAAAE
ncbi:hydroxymethylglutaryl-CoA reductase, degradative [bacterium]|nr:hydroxymethylglutaryl-CoA reductase, degradative [candidate division CSSED10-310 bacterium]